ncbi:hypothetical protein ACFS07_33440 [Undibacterium arcticum]
MALQKNQIWRAPDLRADAPDGEMFEQQLADVEARYADSCSGSRSKNGRARIGRRFRLELTANDGGLVLTLSANELAIDGAGSHSMPTGSS